MEIEIDTSLITATNPNEFFVRAELEDTPGIFAFSNQLSVSVICGSETVSVTQEACELVI